jgi:hypothetical protein
MAVWQHYTLLEDMAFPDWRTDGTVLIRIFLRGGEPAAIIIAVAAWKSTFFMTFSKLVAPRCCGRRSAIPHPC